MTFRSGSDVAPSHQERTRLFQEGRTRSGPRDDRVACRRGLRAGDSPQLGHRPLEDYCGVRRRAQAARFVQGSETLC